VPPLFENEEDKEDSESDYDNDRMDDEDIQNMAEDDEEEEEVGGGYLRKENEGEEENEEEEEGLFRVTIGHFEVNVGLFV